MNHPTETAKQIADLIRGDLIAAMQVREFISAADLIDLLALNDAVNVEVEGVTERLAEAEETIDDLRADNLRLERLLNGK